MTDRILLAGFNQALGDFPGMVVIAQQTTLIEQPDIDLGNESDDLLSMDGGFDFEIPDILGTELDEP